jgi:hypothetical protein
MIKRDELKGPSCLTNAADDEPLFVLRANDELAAAVVVTWANRYVQAKGGIHKMTRKQLEKWLGAIDLSRVMGEWRAAHTVKSDAAPPADGV